MKKHLLFAAMFAASFSAKAQTVTTISGTGDAGYSTSNLTNIADAQYDMPYTAVMDSKENIWVADQANNYIIMLEKSTGKYRIRGGDFNGGFADGSGPGGSKFAFPSGIAVGANDTLYIVDTDNNAIRRMNPFTSAGISQMVTTLAGGGPKTGNNGAGGYVNATGINARFRHPSGIAISPDRSYLLVADRSNHIIRKISIKGGTYGQVTLLAGTPGEGATLDGTYLNSKFHSPESITFDEKTGDIYVVDADGGLRKLSNGNVTTIIESSKIDAATSAVYVEPFIFIANGCNIKRFNTTNNKLELFAGNENTTGDPCGFKDGKDTAAKFDGLATITLSTDKTYLIASDAFNNRIRKVTVSLTIGINETTNAEDIFEIYPNPANNYIMLQPKNQIASGRTTIQLFDVAGRLFVEQHVQFSGNAQRIELPNTKPGLYILKTTSSNGASHTSRIIISQ